MQYIRRSRITIWILAVLLIAGAVSAEKNPRNVIMMIGDGMGPAQVTYAGLMLNEGGNLLRMESMPHSAFVKTQAANAVITDSAAAGTALASGFKTNNGMISSLPDGTPVETILERAMKLGKSTGLVTTTTITHATPASFGSHVNNRGDEADIAPQYIEKAIDVLMGGGRAFFIPKSLTGSARKDERNLITEAAKGGYRICYRRDSMLSVGQGKLLGLFELGAMTTEAPEPSLAEMTNKAISLLSSDEDGFFLMVEGGQIDWRCHANDAPGALKQMRDFDEAVGIALDFARKRKDTLVIVTADHETGGLTLVSPEKDSKDRIGAKFSTTDHTALNVPLFAEGPGSALFDGVIENTSVPRMIASLWKAKTFAQLPVKVPAKVN